MTALPENNRYRDFNFREEKLYILDTDTGVSIEQDGACPPMFRVRWPDGVLSADKYNFTMARENARTIASKL